MKENTKNFFRTEWIAEKHSDRKESQYLFEHKESYKLIWGVRGGAVG
jgi:hypothetical protein